MLRRKTRAVLLPVSRSRTVRGECLACKKVETCLETSISKLKNGYTCPLFEEVAEPIYTARYNLICQFGEEMALKAIMNRETKEEEEGK